MTRPQVVGPASGPEHPFPIQLSGRIIKGFGRGSKELGIPTANIPITGLDVGGHSDVESGVYYGWAGLSLVSATNDASKAAAPPAPNGEESHGDSHVLNIKPPPVGQTSHDSASVYPMVMSIGWNPFYKNKVRSVEVHIIHNFSEDFYNALMNISILGFIRHEKDYENLDSLVEDIRTDIRVAENSLNRKAYEEKAEDEFLKDFCWAKL